MNYKNLEMLYRQLKGMNKELKVALDNVYEGIERRDFGLEKGLDIIEQQLAENEENKEKNRENRFLGNYYNPVKTGLWNEAVGVEPFEFPKTELEYSKLSNEEKAKLEQTVLKELVVNSARRTNATNKTKFDNSKAYDEKNEAIIDFLAYAQMYNTKYPDDAICYGLSIDEPENKRTDGTTSEKSILINASIPGFSRLSVHTGNLENASWIIMRANQEIGKYSPYIGIEPNKAMFENRNMQRECKEIRKQRENLPYRKRQKAKQPLTEAEELDYSIFKGHINNILEGLFEKLIENQKLQYPLEIFNKKTGLMSRAIFNDAESFITPISKTKDVREMEILFNMVYASQGFNENEILYLSEQAGKPAPDLIKTESEIVPRSEQLKKRADANKTSLPKEFLKYKLSEQLKKNSSRKNFLDTCWNVYKIAGVATYENAIDLIEMVNSDDIQLEPQIKEEFSNVVLSDMLKEGKNSEESEKNKKKIYEYMSDESGNLDEQKVKKIFSLVKNNPQNLHAFLDKFDSFDMFDVIEYTEIDKEEKDVKKTFSEAFSKKIQEFDEEDLEEFLCLDDEEEFVHRFPTLLSVLDEDSKKKVMEKTLRHYKENGKDPSMIEEIILDGEDGEIVEENIDIYTQIQETVHYTTPESRKKANGIEQALEVKKGNVPK